MQLNIKKQQTENPFCGFLTRVLLPLQWSDISGWHKTNHTGVTGAQESKRASTIHRSEALSVVSLSPTAGNYLGTEQGKYTILMWYKDAHLVMEYCTDTHTETRQHIIIASQKNTTNSAWNRQSL